MQNLPGRLLGAGGPLLAGDLKIAAAAAVLGLSADDLLTGVANGHIKSIDDIPAYLEQQLEGAIQKGEELIGTPLWELLVRAPAGLDAAKVENGQAADAVKMVKRMLGFGLALPLLTSKLEAALDVILGGHAPKGLLESIRRLPEEIGVNFFIGTVLERIFETAVATPLEEAIAEQTRPARFDFRVVKALLLKHHITADEARLKLARIGYHDDDIAKVLELSEQFLSVADLQQLYLMGKMSLAEAETEMAKLGYSAEDVGRLSELYLVKAETQGGQQLRATARGGYLEGKITEGEYRQLLASVNTPALSIDLEVESANLQLTWGRRQLSVLNIKQLHQQGHTNDRQAEQQLERIGFTAEDAQELLVTWTVEKKTTHVGLTVPRILAYELGGIITRAQTLALLMETGMKTEEASMLAQNPAHLGGVYAHPRTTATVLSALKEGILSVEDTKIQLAELGMEPGEIDLSIQVNVSKSVRGAKPRAAHRNLSEAQVIEAFKQDLVSSGWAVQELVSIGYADADAQLLLAIEISKLSGAPPPNWVTLS